MYGTLFVSSANMSRNLDLSPAWGPRILSGSVCLAVSIFLQTCFGVSILVSQSKNVKKSIGLAEINASHAVSQSLEFTILSPPLIYARKHESRAQGQDFTAHRCVLSTASPFFRALFTSQFQQNESNIIELKEISIKRGGSRSSSSVYRAVYILLVKQKFIKIV